MLTLSLPARLAMGILAFILSITFLVRSQPEHASHFIDKASHLVDKASSLNSPLEQRGDNILDVQNQTLGFSKLLVISMKNRHDKHDLWALASLYTNITYEYVDGVPGGEIPEKALPAGWIQDKPEDDINTIGCYRGHMNAIQKIVNERIPSALIFEDDADWDFMVKDQLIDFARGSRYIQKSDDVGLNSPYGDDWDMLWLGHCGMKSRGEWEDTQYWVTKNDPTLVPWRHRTNKSRWPKVKGVSDIDGEFTRLIYEPANPLCAFTYALSLKGAEKLLYRYSVQPGATVWDRSMAWFCKDRSNKCVGVFPGLFESYKAAGNMTRDSDRLAPIPGQEPQIRMKGETLNLGFPMKQNLESFVTKSKAVPAHYDNMMVKSMDKDNVLLPTGYPVYMRKDDFLAKWQP